MSLSVDLYVHAASWLHRLDPRVKLWATVAGSIAAFLLNSPLLLLGFLLLIIGVLRGGRVPAGRITWALRGLLPLTLLILIIQPWFVTRGTPIFTLGPLRLTTDGVSIALIFAIRANVLALLALLPLFTTRHDDLVRGLVQLGLPYPWGMTITLALRYIPVAAGLYATIRHAQEARGLDLQHGGLIKRVRQFVPILTALVIASVRLSDQLAMAMTVRGLNAGPRTERRVLVMAGRDWIAAGLIGLWLAGLIVLRGV